MITQQNIERLNRENFRSCLEVLARPGSVYQIQPLDNSVMMAMASALLFPEVSFYQETDGDWPMIKAITGSVEAKKQHADYLFLDRADHDILTEVKYGDQFNPEYGATLFFRCESFEKGCPVVLQGSGIREKHKMTLPVSPAFLHQLAEKNRHFPLGVDLFFLSGNNRICGLPRTTHVELL